VLNHLALECLPVRKLLLLQTRAQTWTATSYAQQVSFDDRLADIDWSILRVHKR